MSQHIGLKNRILKGLGANAYGQAVTIGIQIVNVPLFIAFWGVDLYGEWLILSALPAYLALGDLGLGAVAANSMAMSYASENKQRVQVIFHSLWGFTLLISAIVVSVCIAAIIASSSFIQWGFAEISPRDGYVALMAMIIYVLTSFYISVFNAGFRTVGRYAYGILLAHHIRLFEWLVSLLVLFAGGGVLWFAIALLIARCLGIVVLYLIYKSSVSWLRLGVKLYSKSEIGQLIKPGLSYLCFPLTNAIFNQGAILLIGTFLSPAMVVIFNAYRTITRLLVQAVGLINQSVLPEITAAYGAKNTALFKKLYRRLCLVAVIVSSLGVPSLMLLGSILLMVWLGENVTFRESLYYLLVVAVGINILWQGSQVLLMAINHHQKISYFYLFSSILFIAIGAAFIPLWGVEGVAMALILVEVLLLVYVFSQALHKIRSMP